MLPLQVGVPDSCPASLAGQGYGALTQPRIWGTLRLVWPMKQTVPPNMGREMQEEILTDTFKPGAGERRVTEKEQRKSRVPAASSSLSTVTNKELAQHLAFYLPRGNRIGTSILMILSFTCFTIVKSHWLLENF